MLKYIISIYTFIFSRKIFYKYNRLMHLLSLHAIGILNYKNNKQSDEEFFLKNELSSLLDGVVLDVGANVGNYCVSLRGLNTECKIYAFEPHPLTYSRLIQNTKSLDVKTFNFGVGRDEGELTLFDYAGNDGSEHASLHEGVIEKIHKGEAVGHKVRILSLDNFVKQEKLGKIALLKIDTEGHELEVLHGAKNLLTRGDIAIIHLEFNEMNVISRVFFKDIWDLLPNYDIYRMLPSGLLHIKSYRPVDCELFAYQNIVAKIKKNYA